MKKTRSDEGGGGGGGGPVSSSPTREVCQICHETSPVGFCVPDAVWLAVTGQRWRHAVLCLRCFAKEGDRRLVGWSRGIEFYPVSLVMHLEAIGFERTERDDG